MQRGWYLGEAAPKPIQTGPEGVPRLRTDKLVPLGWRITPLMVQPCGHGTKDLHKSKGKPCPHRFQELTGPKGRYEEPQRGSSS
jgi:hypothetical protein